MALKQTSQLSFKSKDFINYKRLRLILDNWETLINSQEIHISDLEWDDKMRTILLKYIKKVKIVDIQEGIGEVNTSYYYSKIRKTKGRQYVYRSLGLQSMARSVRHTLTHDLLYDIDMVNAHFTILSQYCKKKNYPCEEIEKSVIYNEEYKQDLMKLGMNYHQAKRFKIKMCYGSTEKSKVHWFQPLYDEIKKIHELMMNEPENQEIIDSINEHLQQDNDYENLLNIEGKLCSHIMCELENNILVECINFLKKCKLPLNDIVLSFDGFMIKKNLLTIYSIDEFLKKMMNYVFKQTGYDVKLIVKPQNEIINLEGLKTKRELIVENDREAGDLVLEAMSGKIIEYNEIVFVKDRFSNIWTDSIKKVGDEIYNVSINMDIKKLSPSGKPLPFSANVTGAKAIKTHILKQCPKDNHFLETLRLASKNKIFFKNGVYDFKERAFRPETEEDMTPVRIDSNFPEIKDEESDKFMIKLINSLFEYKELDDTKLSPLALNMIQHIARGLAGSIEDKEFVVTTGLRNSGKGVLTLLCTQSFGKYASECDANNFLKVKHRSGDEAKSKMWLVNHIWSRLLFTNECEVDDNNDDSKDKNVINGLFLKTLLSGGDTIRARELYKTEIDFIFGGRLFMFANEIPTIHPADTCKQMSLFYMPNKFLKPEEYHSLEKKGKLDPYMKLGNPNIKDILMREKKYINSFIRIVIDNYPNHSVKNIREVQKMTCEFQCEMGDENMFYKQYFDFTDKNAFLSSSDIEKLLRNKNNKSFTFKKITFFLTKNMHLESARRRINGIITRGYLGVKLTGEGLELITRRDEKADNDIIYRGEDI